MYLTSWNMNKEEMENFRRMLVTFQDLMRAKGQFYWWRETRRTRKTQRVMGNPYTYTRKIIPQRALYVTTARAPMATDIVYRLFQDSDADVVRNMLYCSFVLEDPLEVSLSIESPREAMILVEPVVIAALADGVSVVAEHHPSGELAGVCLNTADTQSQPKSNIYAERDVPDSERMNKVLEFLRTLSDDVEIFKEFDMEKALNIRIVNVLRKYCGNGIGRTLVQKSILLAMKNSCTVACAEATGVYSQKLFHTLGFQTIKEVFYMDYYKDGQQVFTNTGIHKSCKVVAKNLNVSFRDRKDILCLQTNTNQHVNLNIQL